LVQKPQETDATEEWKMGQQCPTCGKSFEENVRFCPNDGTPLAETSADTTRTFPGRSGGRPELKLPLLLGNRYELIEYRGGGGMAKVYKAIDRNLDRDVAVKLINPSCRSDPEFDARFQREARIVSQLSDPHIVVVHDFGIDAEQGPFLVMEYLKGQTLRERLQADGVLPLKAGIQLGAQLLLALIHAHDKNVIHRDIKPDNIFILNQSGVRLHVRVLDFGIARICQGDAEDDTLNEQQPLTKPGAILGTPRYMSPEQLAGNPLDVRTDLYSAAMVIYESLTGKLPTLTGKTLVELVPEAPTALSLLLEQCLKANPDDRPSSAVEVYLGLQELGRASGIVLLPPGAINTLLSARGKQPAKDPTTAVYPTADGNARPPWMWPAVIAGGVALLVCLVWLVLYLSGR
jgi:serine/threonine-protein kinase